jgi:hypothetical protein
VTNTWKIKMRWGRGPQIMGGSISNVLVVSVSLGLDMLQYWLVSVINFINNGGYKEQLKLEIIRELVA